MSRLIRDWSAIIGMMFCLSACAPAPAPKGLQEEDLFISSRDRDSVTYARAGMALLKQSRYIDAEIRFRKALWLEPRAKNVLAGLGTVLALQGQFDEAKVIFGGLREEAPESLEVLSGLAYVLFLAGEYEDSATVYEATLAKAIEKEDASAPVLARSLAALYFRVGDEQGARCASSQALVLKPDVVETIVHARLLTALGDYGGAETLLSSFATANKMEMDPRIQARLALAYYGLGKNEDARSMSSSALEAPSLPPEERLVMEILAEAVREPEEVVEGEGEDEEEDVLSPAELASRVQPSVALTWPAPLLDVVSAMRAAGEEEMS